MKNKNIAVFGNRLAWQFAGLVVPFWIAILASCRSAPEPSPAPYEIPFDSMSITFDSTVEGKGLIQYFDEQGCEIHFAKCEDSDSVIVYMADTSYIKAFHPVRFRMRAGPPRN